MAQWFETSVTYDKMMENGTIRKSTEKFLFDALSFTEAEARTIEERTPLVSGEFSVKTAKRTKIAEIFFDDWKRRVRLTPSGTRDLTPRAK